MQRKTFIRSGIAGIAGLAFARLNSYAQFLQLQSYQITMLTERIGYFTERGGTILFMLSEEGTVVVDSQFPESAEHLIQEIKKKTIFPFRLLINTHHHGDHTAGNISFKSLCDKVLAHQNSKKNQENNAKKNNTEDKQYYPNLTFSNTWCEKIGKEHICMYYYGPAHTDGDGIVEFKKSHIVHVGDLVFNRRHPFIDTSAGANIKNWIKVLDKINSTFSRKTRFICGHAGDGYPVEIKKHDILAFKNYLSNVLKYTEEQIKLGKSLEEILKTSTSIPGSPEWTGGGIERSLKAAYEEVVNY